MEIGMTVKIEHDAFSGYATIIRVGRSGNWATARTSNGGTMVIGRRHIVADDAAWIADEYLASDTIGEPIDF